MVTVNPNFLPETNLTRFLKDFMSKTNFGTRLINSFNSDYLSGYIDEFGAMFAKYLTSLPPKRISLPQLSKDVNLTKFLNTTFNLSTLVKPVIKRLSRQYFTESIQSKASSIHVESLIKLSNEIISNVMSAKLTRMDGMVKRDPLRKQILTNLINDQVLKRYIGSFLVPADSATFQMIYKYTEEKIYKLISDTIVASAAITKAQPTVILGQLLEQIVAKSDFLQNVLNRGYCKIRTSIAAHLQLNKNLYLFLGPAYVGKQHHFYSEMVSRFYNVPSSFSSYQGLDGQSLYYCDVNRNVPELITKVLEDINAKLKWNVNLQYNRTGLGSSDQADFDALNRKAIFVAEMSDTQEKACLSTEKHSLVREASFDKKKFAHCGKTIYDFRRAFLFASISKVSKNIKFLVKS